MLKLLQGILANKITTENVRLFARLVLLRCVMANQYWIINAAFFAVNV